MSHVTTLKATPRHTTVIKRATSITKRNTTPPRDDSKTHQQNLVKILTTQYRYIDHRQVTYHLTLRLQMEHVFSTDQSTM
jgi:hypothetical protein